MRPSLVAAGLAVAFLSPAAHAQQKQPIDRADQLPVHTYAVAVPPSTLLHDEAALGKLLEPLRTDLEADLAAYDIRDAAALRSYYRALETIALLQHRSARALEYEDRARALEEKPAERLLSGYLERSLLAAERAGPAGATQAFAAALAEELQRLPYDSVQAALKIQKGKLELLSPGLYEAQAANRFDPRARSGRISQDAALQVVRMGWALQRLLPYRDEVVRQLSVLIAAHDSEKPDIWAARDVPLAGRPGLTPVVVAISDVGVDVSLFPGRLWTNPKEIPGNGRDDDGNGYVDDVHGIGFAWNGAPVTGELRPVTIPAQDLARATEQSQGVEDLMAGLDSPEAQAARRTLAALPPEERKAMQAAHRFYVLYAHGTHVAGIAVRGNPAARILVLRKDDPYELPSSPPTAASIAAYARALERSVAYVRQAGVRVVNMSWLLTAGEFEQVLERNAVGAGPAERRRLAVQYYDTIKAAFGAAIAHAPEMLFVSGAGNSNSSNQFDEGIPASFDYPNTITVGAVDQAGNEWARTSFGKVDVYANGVRVESVVPGGSTQRKSGTSMASPQVANLAAKLFAVYPRLTAVDVKKLILDGADAHTVSAGRSIRLLNEAKSFELAGGLPKPK